MTRDRVRDAGALTLLVAVLGFLFSGYLALTLLASSDWNPTVFLKFGVESPETVYGEQRFDELVLAAHAGHDGKYYLIQASDPFYLDPSEHARYLDRPSYRAQRMLYPTVAGLFGLLPPLGIAWSLLLVNLVSVGIGTYLTSLLARQLGLSPWFGLAFALNPGIFISATLDTAEVMATAAVVGSVLLFLRGRELASSVVMTLAVLARESMVIAAFGLIAYVALEKRRLNWHSVLPLLVPASWWLYLRARIGYLSPEIQDTAAIGPPFEGFVDAMRFWTENPGNSGDMLTGFVLLALSGLVIYRALRHRGLLPLVVAGFGLLSILMSRPVWEAYFDATRVLAPLLTFYLLMVPVGRGSGSRRENPRPVSPVG